MNDWFPTSLFWLGALLFLVGLSLVLLPVRIMGTAKAMDRWISTRHLLNAINTPHYQESIIYRHHRISGAVIALLALIAVYMFAFFTSRDVILSGIETIADSAFAGFLLTDAYYLLLGLNVLALVIGIVVFVRPSLLKRVEAWGNRWVDTDSKLEALNRVHEIPESILPGRPRWFGVFVVLGSLYIMYMMRGAVI